VVAEESGASHAADPAGDTDVVTWFVDPLDGTVNYLYAIPHFAVSIAAQWAGETIAGVVLDVPRDEMYAATRGGGAALDGVPLHCTGESDPAVSLVATGFGYAATLREQQAATLTTLLPRVRDLRRQGSAALDLCAVAAGRVDAFFEAGMHPWDWAAGALIATEAGARVGSVSGGPPGAGTTVAANPGLYDELVALLRAAGVPG
jgi:myo-inositol-1(or 4)-monophosphatase